VFASGSNHAGEIRGWAGMGRDLGVAAPELSEAAVVELEALAGTDVAVFVDSGAFSEVTFGADGPKVVKPITDAEWLKRLALYERLATALGGQVHVVAPDQVGNQAVTLERLERYRAQLHTIAALGAHILVPVQKGDMSQADFMRAAEAIVGLDVVPSIPCKKAATTPEELGAFCADYKPTRMHLLGLGARGSRTPKYLAQVAELAPDAQVTLDSCVIRAHCNSDRRIGVARKIALGLKAAWTVAARKEFELTLAFGAC
jgi:hypothetical protein